MKTTQDQILIADDDPVICKILQIHLEKAGYAVILASDGEEAIRLMNEDIHVVLLDLKMPKLNGFECLINIKDRFPDTPVIMVSSASRIKDAVIAMKNGAMDYVNKPINLDELKCLVDQAVKIGRGLKERTELKQILSPIQPQCGFVGVSDYAKELFQQVSKIATVNSTVLITGESGTGKSLLAQIIHTLSNRKKGPFISVSCPSLPRELLESEMFGHERGAFTGALQRRIGRIEAANGGVLFLDEIGDLPLYLQPKLLAFLQTKRFTRVGGSNVLEADVRIIAATNVDLNSKIRSGEFREDLFFRLNVLPIRIIPLRERTDDILPLVKQILTRISKERGGSPIGIDQKAQELLSSYLWPGNVRELENVLERASAFCQENEIRLQDLPLEIQNANIPIKPSELKSQIPQINGIPLAELEKMAIQQTLISCSGNKAKAARQLGITEKSIYNKMSRFGLR